MADSLTHMTSCVPSRLRRRHPSIVNDSFPASTENDVTSHPANALMPISAPPCGIAMLLSELRKNVLPDSRKARIGIEDNALQRLAISETARDRARNRDAPERGPTKHVFPDAGKARIGIEDNALKQLAPLEQSFPRTVTARGIAMHLGELHSNARLPIRTSL